MLPGNRLRESPVLTIVGYNSGTAWHIGEAKETLLSVMGTKLQLGKDARGLVSGGSQ